MRASTESLESFHWRCGCKGSRLAYVWLVSAWPLFGAAFSVCCSRSLLQRCIRSCRFVAHGVPLWHPSCDSPSQLLASCLVLGPPAVQSRAELCTPQPMCACFGCCQMPNVTGQVGLCSSCHHCLNGSVPTAAQHPWCWHLCVPPLHSDQPWHGHCTRAWPCLGCGSRVQGTACWCDLNETPRRFTVVFGALRAISMVAAVCAISPQPTRV